MLNHDEIVEENKIYKTINYEKFHRIPGNRPVDKKHVKSLENRIKKYGNLTSKFPIEVTKNFGILDGQHRIPALQNLKEPVYYTIKRDVTLPMIRDFNSHHANWSWKDIAYSYAEAEERNHSKDDPGPYMQFKEMMTTYKYPFRVLCLYFGVLSHHMGLHEDNDFRNGNFTVKDFELTKRLLGYYDDLRSISKIRNIAFAQAVYRFIRTPGYHHVHMRANLMEFGEPLNQCYTTPEYMLALEDIYKVNQK